MTRWDLTTVIKTGSDLINPSYNILTNAQNQNRGAVLAEPFPWTVIQGVILVLVIVNNQIYVVGLGWVGYAH